MSSAEYDLAILASNVNRDEGYAVTACGALLVNTQLLEQNTAQY